MRSRKASLVRGRLRIVGRPARRCREMTHQSTAAICRTPSIDRNTPYRSTHRRREKYAKADDPVVTAQIREIIRERRSYGYRRVMEMNGWNLLRPVRRRNGQAHTGRIVRRNSNERWHSDTLQISCRNGELVELGIVLDCHDREAIAHVAAPPKYRSTALQQHLALAARARFGSVPPVKRVQSLSDNGSIYVSVVSYPAKEEQPK